MERGSDSNRARRSAILLTALFIAAGCAASAPPATWTTATSRPANVSASVSPSTDPVARAAWTARPAFVRGAAATEGAYAFALANPNILKWIPCYCGCAALGHRSNLDCFIVPTDGGAIRFEEHASYCDVCVKEALMAKQMLADGKSMLQIRNAIDAQFGGHGAPGTDTQMPSA